MQCYTLYGNVAPFAQYIISLPLVSSSEIDIIESSYKYSSIILFNTFNCLFVQNSLDGVGLATW